jgi:sirohydrochlorin ferrochelatase
MHRALTVLAAALFGASQVQAQQGGSVGTLLVAHGASTEWNAQVEQLAAQAHLAGPIEICYIMGPGAASHLFQDAAARLAAKGATKIVVVPLLVSSHSEHYEQVRWLAGATDSLSAMMQEHTQHAGHTRAQVSVPMVVARALDDSPAMAQVLADRGKALVSGDVSRRALFLVGHGPNSAEDYAAWMSNLRRVADSVRVRSGFGDVRVDVVRDDAPAEVRSEAVMRVRELITMQYRITGDTVVVVPVLISRGRISRESFMKDLDGLPVAYSGDPLLPHPALSQWLESRVGEGSAVAVVKKQ